MSNEEVNQFKNSIKNMSPEELKKKIEEVKAEPCHGSPCEVFSRVVGYMRPVQNWNKGKKEEYAMRKMMKIENAVPPCKCE